MSDDYSRLFHSHRISIFHSHSISIFTCCYERLSTSPAACYIQGSLECNNLFRTPPCYIDLSHVVEFLSCMFKRRHPSANALQIFLAHPYNYIFLHQISSYEIFSTRIFPIYGTQEAFDKHLIIITIKRNCATFCVALILYQKCFTTILENSLDLISFLHSARITPFVLNPFYSKCLQHLQPNSTQG